MNLRSVLAILTLMLLIGLVHAEKWQGLDTEMDARAEELGANPGGTLFQLEGDLPLFMFALAGAAAGFIMGYNWRRLFKEKDGLEEVTDHD